MADQLATVNKKWLITLAGSISAEEMEGIGRAIGDLKFSNKIDGFIKSPISALRCISSEFHVRLTTLHSSIFARLDLELFTLPSKN